MAADKKPTFFSRIKIVFVIVGIILIPIVMDQAKMNEEDVKIVGRVCGGIAGLFTIDAIIHKMLKIFAVIVLAIIALAVLVSEGVIEPPYLIEMFSGR